ncbi:longitudinals lacking protein, isoforms H/M/V isoform X7 [Drosophila mojavensis]|uniref:longitudinals lacking protein, isoforms H/M/V isoform X7 n=1 Tax=Drosophila mojavensis TaxID=7230 RepID=UPI0013EE803F|nr:longitudinals lacking protein, isoforms H/M/V isoform X7 [Drosophila mojavensis]
MDDDQQFCLRWNNHQSTLISVFDTLLENETLVDCTLAAEGKFLKAHKVVLSACSPYFATLLQEQYDKHPIFILKDVKYQELRAMMDYMYRGEVNISQDQLTALLKAAESLQIKGLSDNRSGTGPAAAAAAQQQQQAPKPDTHHRVKLSAPYTLEQTKRARVTTGGAAVGVGGMVDAGDVAGSREGSSSPSRRRRKVRRRSMENDMHDNSNSSVLAAASNQSILQQTSAGLAASALVSTQLASGSGAASATVAAAASSGTGSQVINQPLTSSSSSSSNVTKKTESAKLTSTAAAQGAQQQQQQQQQQQTTSDAINTDNVQQQQNQGAQGEAEEMDVASGGAASGAVAVHPGVVKQLTTLDKSNHKQKIKDNSITTTEMVIEPKAEYDDDAHDENVEDLTLDEEDMTMEELDQAAGTSQGGEGSSQAYATWQHDRSQDELGLMAAQDAQQRDPQGYQQQLQQQHQQDSSNSSYKQDDSCDMHLSYQGATPTTTTVATATATAAGAATTSASATPLHHFQAPQFDNFQSMLSSGVAAAAAAAAAATAALAANPLEESFTCPQCYRTYRRHGTLRRHLRQECGKGKSMVCSVCGHRTKRADHLRQHVRKKHPEIAMRSLFKRQQRAAAAKTEQPAAQSSASEDIVDLDMLDDGLDELAEESQHQQQLRLPQTFIVDDDDEDNNEHEQGGLTADEQQQQPQMDGYYQQQLHQQALQQLQKQLQQQQQLHVLAAAAAVAKASSKSSGSDAATLNC